MRVLILIAVVVACAATVWLLTQYDFRTSGPQNAQAIYTDGGTEACLKCHSGESITLIAATAHGDKNNPFTPYAQKGCESCHGPGSLHVSRARGGTGMPALLQFGDRSTRPQQTAACLDCHGKAMGNEKAMLWTGSPHDTPRITCVSCHSIHTAENPVDGRERQVLVCSGCHAREVRDHPQLKGRFEKRKCSACHDVHRAKKD